MPRELEKAKLERFLLVESFGGLLDMLMGEDEKCSLSGRELEEWNVFKGALITLTRRPNRTRVEVSYSEIDLVDSKDYTFIKILFFLFIYLCIDLII